MKTKSVLTEKEKTVIQVLNFIATFDGLITEEDDRRYILETSIQRFISKKRRKLLSITETAYPTKIKIKKNECEISKN